MRLPYETPEITLLGSVRELTQGFNLTVQQDSVYGANIPVGGDPVGS